MKTLRSLFALCALSIFAITARADAIEFTQESFYSDHSGLENSYHAFGYNSGDDYSLTLDYYFQTLDIDYVLFEAWFIDDTESVYIGGSEFGGAIEAGEDMSFLDIMLALPSETPGTLRLSYTFVFSDSTQLSETLSAEID
jgi:hypothetical protein